jgi:hypothetical protein
VVSLSIFNIQWLEAKTCAMPDAFLVLLVHRWRDRCTAAGGFHCRRRPHFAHYAGTGPLSYSLRMKAAPIATESCFLMPVPL